ncbi:MAG: hypothetical protein CL535_11465 [Ahrensia sp.]|nr:hypothetical protein [Ahrensia sp.]
MSRRLILATFMVTAIGGVATAADYAEPAAQYQAPLFFGYVDIHAGHYDYDDGLDIFDEADGLIGGAARLAVRMSPSFTLQGDLWTNMEMSDVNGSYDYPGAALHVTWNPGDGRMLGAMGSIGEDNNRGRLANIALEGVHEMDRWRFYGQAGYMFGLTGSVDDTNDHYWYGAANATYFQTDNLALSASLGAAKQSYDFIGGPLEVRYINWGLRAEIKHDTVPASAYFAYRGISSKVSSAIGDGSAVDHRFVVGLRFFFNQSTLREINRGIGLVDMNPAYGDLFAY